MTSKKKLVGLHIQIDKLHRVQSRVDALGDLLSAAAQEGGLSPQSVETSGLMLMELATELRVVTDVLEVGGSKS